MKVPVVFAVFFGTYVVLSVLVVVGFALAGAKPISGLNTAILLAAVTLPCMRFAEKNGRYFSADEKRRVVGGMIGIDLFVQALVALPALGFIRPFPFGALLAGLVFVMVMHAIIIYLFVGLAGRMALKQQEQLALKKAR